MSLYKYISSLHAVLPPCNARMRPGDRAVLQKLSVVRVDNSAEALLLVGVAEGPVDGVERGLADEARGHAHFLADEVDLLFERALEHGRVIRVDADLGARLEHAQQRVLRPVPDVGGGALPAAGLEGRCRADLEEHALVHHALEDVRGQQDLVAVAHAHGAKVPHGLLHVLAEAHLAGVQRHVEPELLRALEGHRVRVEGLGVLGHLEVRLTGGDVHAHDGAGPVLRVAVRELHRCHGPVRAEREAAHDLVHDDARLGAAAAQAARDGVHDGRAVGQAGAVLRLVGGALAEQVRRVAHLGVHHVLPRLLEHEGVGLLLDDAEVAAHEGQVEVEALDHHEDILEAAAHHEFLEVLEALARLHERPVLRLEPLGVGLGELVELPVVERAIQVHVELHERPPQPGL
mmetsp:Transcript_5117/g.14530  ORF Transcript_5117/g.14530 Transcript_5117/m.14530 type:complete len:403 (-) Transcript_5117:207-1415(-)